LGRGVAALERAGRATDPDHMRASPFAAVTLATLAIAPAASVAQSGTPEPLRSGGAAYGTPGPLRSGGATYGSPLPVPDARPIARRLTPTPTAITAGDRSPTIRLRVRQRGIARVQARIVVLRLPSNRPVGRVRLGWVKTGRSITVALPSALQLRTGRYLVRLHVTDPRGHRLRRNGTYPGRARIVVHRQKPRPTPPTPAPAPSAPAVPLVPAPAPSPGGPGVFPVAGAFDFGGADARFGAGRVGHIHQGQDILAAGGTPVVAPYAGTVNQTSYQASGAGEYVVVDGADGRSYFFAHCLRRSTVVIEGAAVAAGQTLCLVGATGTTSGATHLHFEIWVVGWHVPGGAPIDPLPELRAWAGA
jgi:murein DD-endopeptidase MepM/ murein hydrolase activator NlpD